MVSLIAVAQPLKNVDCKRRGWLCNLNGLEPPGQRSIFFKVLAIFIQGCRPDGLKLASCEHRLQDRRGIDSALCGSGTNKGVDFIDKSNDVSASADFLCYFL